MTDAERGWARAGGVCGLLGMIGLVASLPLAPPWPTASAPSSAVLAYFVEHRRGFLAQACLANCAVVLLVPLAWALYELLRARGRAVVGGTVLGALVLFVAAFGIFWIPWIAIAFRAGHQSEALVQLLYDVGLLGQFLGVGPCLALLFGAVTLAAWNGEVLPRWLAFVGALQVPLNVALAASSANEGLLTPSGPIGMASIGLFTLFGFGASIGLLRRSRRPS